MNKRFPGVLQEVFEVAGAEAALAVQAKYGGMRVAFPSGKRLRQDHPLVEILGYDVAVLFLQRLCPSDVVMNLDIPLGSMSRTTETREAVRKCIEDGLLNGWSSNRIAQNCRCSSRTVFNHKSRMVEAGDMPTQALSLHHNPYRTDQYEAHRERRDLIKHDLMQCRRHDLKAISAIAIKYGCSIALVNLMRTNLRAAGKLPRRRGR